MTRFWSLLLADIMLRYLLMPSYEGQGSMHIAKTTLLMIYIQNEIWKSKLCKILHLSLAS